MIPIDTTTYNKVARGIPLGNGYDRRPTPAILSILIHTTNGNRDSSFRGEAEFLCTSPAVGAHYLIGKRAGEIAEIVPPTYRAWHAGAVNDQTFNNNNSIGIECHHAVGEAWTTDQQAMLTELVQLLMYEHNIPIERIDTHRARAIPKGRKVDPSDWSDSDFYAWRTTLDDGSPSPDAIDCTVIGTTPKTTLVQFIGSLKRHKAPLSVIEMERVYTVCLWLDIEPAFFIALWKRESGSPLGGSVLQQHSHQPLNIKAASTEWRKTIPYNGEQWHWSESFQLGSFTSLVHLKNHYGAAGLCSVRQIIPIFAPARNGNDVAGYIASILEDMSYIWSH